MGKGEPLPIFIYLHMQLHILGQKLLEVLNVVSVGYSFLPPTNNNISYL